jgi:hypothetical protein
MYHRRVQHDATLAAPSVPSDDELTPLPEADPAELRIVGELARGGMGRVLEARDRLGRRVAVKVLRTRAPEAEERFVREALLTARLQHPSIVPVYEAGRWPSGEPFYVMKLVDGRPLDETIRARPSLRERLALVPSIIAVGDALAYAHSRGVIHRDLKPANVMVGTFGETLVIDWGLAKWRGRDVASQTLGPELPAGETVAGALMGTPSYMAPEQAVGSEADERSDVYALGAMLYTTLAGHPPYSGESSAAVLAQLTGGPPESLYVREPNTPAELLAIVDRAMKRLPSERYASAGELTADLRRFAEGQLVAAYRYPRLALAMRWLRAHRALATGVLAAVLSISLTAGFSVRHILAERRRADVERDRALAALDREARRVDELIVSQARALLATDPTAAIAQLKSLRRESPLGGKAFEVGREAEQRGVAGDVVSLDSAAHSLLFSPPDDALLIGDEDGAVLRYDSSTRKTARIGRVNGSVALLAASPDGKHIVAAGSSLTLLGETTQELAKSGVTAAAVSPSGLVAAGFDDGALRVWQISDGKARASFALGERVREIAITANFVAARGTRGVVVYPLAGGSARKLSADGNGLVFSPDGRWLVAGAAQAVLLQPTSGGAPRRLAANSTPRRLAVSSDGARVASVNDDGSVETFELSSGRVVELVRPGGGGDNILFSPNGRFLAVERGAVVRLWDLEHNTLRKLRGHGVDVLAVAFSSNGQLATAGLDRTARLWQQTPTTLSPSLELPAYLDKLTALKSPVDR